MENAGEEIFSRLREHVSMYAGLRIRLVKLIAIERTTRFVSVLSHGIILMLFAFTAILFLFIALGIYLGEILGSMALGFLIVGGIYLLITLCFVWAREGIRTRLMNVMIAAIQQPNDDDDDTKDQPQNTAGTASSGEEGNPAAMPGVGDED